jgi:protein-disulfide isomerase
MPIRRRTLLSLVALSGLSSTLAPGLAWAEDPRLGQRAIGKPDAKTQVIECFSLTCTHCAAFSQETFPEVKAKLVDTGKVYYIFHDFPLDQVALTAAMVARALPPERYEPFVSALFSSQDRWAFAPGVNSTEELWKLAALAGMSRATFDATVADTAFRDAILAQQKADAARWNIDSTPSFVINGQLHAGEMGYDVFAKLIPNA